MAYDNTNSGILSRNERKEKDTHPDHTGQLNVEGVDYYVSAWIKERKDGTGKFFSLSIKRKDQQQAAPAPKGGASAEDDIPFREMAAGRAFLAM
jgi:hypothetical protein